MNKNEIFTEEAKKVLLEEAQRIAKELEQEAISEALRSRGEPVEVTASDVRKARVRFVRFDRPFVPRSDIILRVYAILGAVVAIGGLFYPFLRPLIISNDPTTRFSLAFAVSGLVISAVALFMRSYIKSVYETKAREKIESYEQDRLDTDRKEKSPPGEQ